VASSTDKTTDRFVEEICRIVIRPVVGILLRCGLSFSRFSEICRSVFVEVAADEFGLGGRRTNTSRISLITGLSRTRVKQELDQLGSAKPQDDSEIDQVRPASRILMAWHVDPDFLDAAGRPLALSIDEGQPSFKQLYDRYSGKIVPITAMLKELTSVGAISKTENGRLKVVMRSYMPSPSDHAATKRVCMAVRDLAVTASHNLYHDPRTQARFERFATNQLIPVDQIEEFTNFLDVEGQAFLERADNWLIEKETSDPSTEVVRIGVGVYQIAPWQAPDPGKKK